MTFLSIATKNDEDVIFRSDAIEGTEDIFRSDATKGAEDPIFRSTAIEDVFRSVAIKGAEDPIFRSIATKGAEDPMFLSIATKGAEDVIFRSDACLKSPVDRVKTVPPMTVLNVSSKVTVFFLVNIHTFSPLNLFLSF